MSRGLAGDDGLHDHRCFELRSACIPSPARGRVGEGCSACWGRLHTVGAHHRSVVGQAHVGGYWVWDARLTSVLILFFLYIGLIALRSALDEDQCWQAS